MDSRALIESSISGDVNEQTAVYSIVSEKSLRIRTRAKTTQFPCGRVREVSKPTGSLSNRDGLIA
jgi:hypothetical protein